MQENLSFHRCLIKTGVEKIDHNFDQQMILVWVNVGIQQMEHLILDTNAGKQLS